MEINDFKISALINKYQSIFNEQMASNQINWATHKICNPIDVVKPTIPFVGKKYGDIGLKILLYASAENLSNYSGYLDNDDVAVNRHRRWFDRSENFDRFFPNVHIAPISDGCLMVALKYICDKLNINTPNNPTDLMESIAFGNYGKFSIETKDSRNKDYANKYKYLQYSEPYVKADIESLLPDLIIMINTIYRTEKIFMDSLVGSRKLITISQINAGTINQSIHKKFTEKDFSTLSKSVQTWYNQLGDNKIKHKTKSNFLSVFTYLDTRIINF